MLFDLLRLFYPDICVGCHKTLLKNEKILCIHCRHDLPIIDIKNPKENIIKGSFYGRVPIEKAVSFLTFRKHGVAQKLIHQLKYNNHEEIGSFLGGWFGHQLKRQRFFEKIDYIIPVPLHKTRLKSRGYNQVTLFGKELSKLLNIPYITDILIRTSNTKTQTKKQRFDRFLNSKASFYLTNKTFFENKHILLVDDVITTGATIEACCNEFLQTENITISIATMAYTERS